jgi:eukaryotic-like serine/threonine-protein kinase
MSGPASTPSGRYRVLHRLASGGMGEVELAIRSEWGFRRIFAVKRLSAALRDDVSARSMFLDEARLAGLVRHPNVVSVLDVGEDERGPFLVMEFVEGISAGTLLRWAGKGNVVLPVQLCLRLVRDIALGLHAAHELTDHDGRPLTLVHRDVSPQNVLIGFDGIACVADFGIAKAAGRTTHTTTGLLKGKAGYMSPEQLRFEELDRRSDIFSLAIVLYELLAARRLYRSENDLQTARRILHEPPPDIDDVRGDVPPEVVELLFASLSKQPADRPATAGEVARKLDSAIATLVQSEGVLDVATYMREHFASRRAEIQEMIANARTQSGTPAPRPAAPVLRSRRAIGVAAAVLVTSISVAAWAFGTSGETSEPEPTVAAPPRPVATAPPPSSPLPPEPPVSPPPPVEEPPAEAMTSAPPPPEAAEPRSGSGVRRGRRERAGASDDGLFRWE